MKKILFLLLVIQSIFGYGQYMSVLFKKPTEYYDSPYMFDVELSIGDFKKGKPIRIKKQINKINLFDFEDETTQRVLKQIDENRELINDRFKNIYKLIEESNKQNYLRPGFLVGSIRWLMKPTKKNGVTIDDSGMKKYSYMPIEMTPQQADKLKKDNNIARLGLLDLAINHIGKNNIKQVDSDILNAVEIIWVCGGDLCQEERLKEDNLTIEWVLSLFARKEAFEALDWKPMYDDGTEPKEPVQKEELEIDPDEITITF